MTQLSGIPAFEIQFDKQGNVFNPAEPQQLLNFLNQGSTTDLLMISHGWNNDMADARDLYKHFFERVRAVLDSGQVPELAGREFAICCILWPSKKFTDQELIPSGAADAGGVVSDDDLAAQLDSLKGYFDHPDTNHLLDQAKELIPLLDASSNARTQFADLIRLLPGKNSLYPDDASDVFFEMDGDELLNTLKSPVLPDDFSSGTEGGAADTVAPQAGGDEGGAAGLGDLLSGIKAGALKVVNFTTYYQMKERAGTVGRNGVNALLRQIRSQFPNLKVHLIGHSFGGRLVTAATLGPDNQPPVSINSLTLLQAAFSHNGFAVNFDGKNTNGFFRRVVAGHQVSGPTVITCTRNDKAVGKAYPMASALAFEAAAEIGDANDRFGGIGRNGALVKFTSEASDGTLLPVGSSYQFQDGRLFNLNADEIITGHSDICKDQVAYAMLKSIATT
ncbi:MAG: hypothetical protein U0Z53_06425 [Blastocatellia bacterium]